MLVTNRSYDICYYQQNNAIITNIQASDDDQAKQKLHSINAKSKDGILFFPASHLDDQKQKKKCNKCDNCHSDRLQRQISYIFQKISGRKVPIDIMNGKAGNNRKKGQYHKIGHTHPDF